MSLVRKNCFMKCDISREENSMRLKIKQFVVFDIKGITNENTFSSSWRKFVSILSYGRSKA